MSIRTALVLTMLGVVALAGTILGFMEVTSIDRNVIREAQSRVDHDLRVVQTHYQRRLELLAERLETEARGIKYTDKDLAWRLRELKRSLGFTILNVCDVEGRGVAGSFPEPPTQVPLDADGLLRRALEGKVVWGTVLLDSERLFIEGGPALQRALSIRVKTSVPEPQTTSALFWWFASPLRDEDDRVVAVVYGGRALNFNDELVDELRELIFGTETYHGKPLGTVTIFLGGVRIATNVLGPDKTRAVGTRVSDEVQREVLERGRSWSDRAWVVDAWYLSGYEPLRNTDGETIGMLYVGLLEAPYVEMRADLVSQFLLAVGLMCVVASVVALLLVRRITRPLENLSYAADRIAAGNWTPHPNEPRGYSETDHLSETFADMQRAISERDLQLRSQNRMLAETNDKLQVANGNYMKMLGFITHELKSPVATIQTMTDALVNDLYGDLPEKATHALTRIIRNCEEMQDMIGDYLDLSRAERGELVANKFPVDLNDEVVQPCAAQLEPLFASRRIGLEIDSPGGIRVEVDAELLRIALGNYLSNAAKYGREGGQTRLRVTSDSERTLVSVWNEGAGFPEAEADKLFKKFSRIRDRNTRGKRGSGLGLCLTKEIVELHGGRVWAESEPGCWARFSFELPVSNVPTHGHSV